jgi:hypothetical protein
MITRSLVRVPLTIASLALAVACSDSPTAPDSDHVLQPLGVLVGAPDDSDFRNFTGQLWACPDAAIPANNFGFLWKIVDNATGQIVARGAKRPVAVGTCTLLASVPTNVSGRYTAWVREDLGGPAPYVLQSISTNYGQNFPHSPPPAATVDLTGRQVWAKMTNDYGVVVVFQH